MATKYFLSKECSLAAHAKFDSILNTLKYEEYPSGEWGWTDRCQHIFEGAGFIVSSVSAGSAASSATVFFKAGGSE